MDDSIGKNFIILPFGYRHYIPLKNYKFTTAEWTSFYSKYADEWNQLIQDYFDDVNQKETYQISKTPDKPDVMGLPLDEWQANLCNAWRKEFLSSKNIEIIRHSEEAYLQETENGVILYVIADPSLDQAKTRHGVGESCEEKNGVWYNIYRYTYCPSHYKLFMSRLKNIQSNFNLNKKN